MPCSAPNCRNQIYARGYCVRHGGKRQCLELNCFANARKQGYCSKHGPPPVKRYCQIQGCDRIAHYRRRCTKHGGGKKCNVDGCDNYSRIKGCCKRHAAEGFGHGWDLDLSDGSPIQFTDEECSMLEFLLPAQLQCSQG
ncbi:unnamed protein product, partial [Aphanomyces euteiches]